MFACPLTCCAVDLIAADPVRHVWRRGRHVSRFARPESCGHVRCVISQPARCAPESCRGERRTLRSAAGVAQSGAATAGACLGGLQTYQAAPAMVGHVFGVSRRAAAAAAAAAVSRLPVSPHIHARRRHYHQQPPVHQRTEGAHLACRREHGRSTRRPGRLGSGALCCTALSRRDIGAPALPAARAAIARRLPMTDDCRTDGARSGLGRTDVFWGTEIRARHSANFISTENCTGS